MAVVQNASELVHYSYGDSTEVFQELGCITTSYTDYSIAQFISRVAERDIDVVVIGPNALNSAPTREALFGELGQPVLHEFLMGGGGLLVLHQGGLAGQGGSVGQAGAGRSRFEIEELGFLPEPLRGIRARLRPITEPPWQGTVNEWQGGGERGDRHIVMAAPNHLEAATIGRTSATNTDVPALYWHYWDDVDVSWWHPLLIDVDSEDRCVVAASREADDWRVVLASVPFDWQKNLPVLANVVSYLADGRPSTVFVSEPNGPSLASRLARTGGRAVGLVFREFVAGRDDEQMIHEARSNTFDTVVVPAQGDLSQSLRDVLDERSAAGHLEVVGLPASANDAILVKGQRFGVHSLVHEFVVEAAAMCSSGLVDGSFWATVDALRSIDTIDRALLDSRFPGKALEVAFRAEQPDGSYNGVFAATLGLAWLKWRFDDPPYGRTLEWLQSRLNEASVRDRLFYWTILAENHGLTVEQTEAASGELKEMLGKSRRQADLIAAAECGRLLDPTGSITAAYLEILAETLAQRQAQDVWLDLGLAGDVMRLSAPLACNSSASENVMLCLELALESLLRWLHTPERGVALPPHSDSSMRVRGKALAGLRRFSDVSPLPLWSLLELLELSTRNAGQRLQRVAKSDLVDYLRQEYVQLSSAHTEANKRLNDLWRRETDRRRRRWPFEITAVLVIYALAATAVAGTIDGTDGIVDVLRTAFAEAYAVHLGIAATVAAVAGVVVAYRQLVEGRRPSSE